LDVARGCQALTGGEERTSISTERAATARQVDRVITNDGTATAAGGSPHSGAPAKTQPEQIRRETRGGHADKFGTSQNAPPPGHLSPKDVRVHGIVGEENFRNLTNAEIMRDPGLKKRLRSELQLKPGEDATKCCLDRIRKAMRYPLSREITKKRSNRS